jgi:hypothetical protein
MSMELEEPGSRLVLIATLVKLLRAVLAPPPLPPRQLLAVVHIW